MLGMDSFLDIVTVRSCRPEEIEHFPRLPLMLLISCVSTSVYSDEKDGYSS